MRPPAGKGRNKSCIIPSISESFSATGIKSLSRKRPIMNRMGEMTHGSIRSFVNMAWYRPIRTNIFHFIVRRKIFGIVFPMNIPKSESRIGPMTVPRFFFSRQTISKPSANMRGRKNVEAENPSQTMNAKNLSIRGDGINLGKIHGEKRGHLTPRINDLGKWGRIGCRRKSLRIQILVIKS